MPEKARIPFWLKPEDYRCWFPKWLSDLTGERVPAVVEEYIGYYYYRLLINRRMYHLGEIALLTLSASIPVAATVGVSTTVLGALGGAVVVVTALRNIFDWRHSWIRAATTFVAMQQQYVDWARKQGVYVDLTAETGSSVLSAKIEAILSQETLAWATALAAGETDDRRRDG